MPEGPFRPQLGQPHHYAYVVEDIEATVDRLVAQLGAGPFFVVENVPLENVRSRGESAEFAHHSAFGAGARAAIELIQPVRLAPERVERAFADPKPRVHHVGYAVPQAEVAGLRSSLDERGLPQYLSSELGEVNSTLHEATVTLGHDLEIHEDCQGLRDFFGMVISAADGWDGSRPLRSVEG